MQLAVDGQIEERQISNPLFQLNARADRPDLFHFSSRLSAASFPPVMRGGRLAMRKGACAIIAKVMAVSLLLTRPHDTGGEVKLLSAPIDGD